MTTQTKVNHHRHCDKVFKPVNGVPRCICGIADPDWDIPTFVVTDEHREKWRKKAAILINILLDGGFHARKKLWLAMGEPLNFSAEVSIAREGGALIPRPKTVDGENWYKMTALLDHSTISGGVHYDDCPTCRCTKF